jgi:hypothetical protein
VNESVYIETSIFGHLTARPTENLILAANIKITQDWWDEYSSSLVLYVSEIVEDEASRGDSTIATQRQNLLQSLIFLDLTEEAIADDIIFIMIARFQFDHFPLNFVVC